MRFRYLAFDLDGTLIDSFPTISEAYRRALIRVYSTGAPTTETPVRLIGLPLKEFFTDYPIADRPMLEEAFRQENDALQYDGVPFFPDMLEVLTALHVRGFSLSIVTSKRRAPVEHWLRTMKVQGLFDSVVAREDTLKGKPDGQPLLLCLDQLGCRADDALYIGDTVHDLACAKNAGVSCAIVGWTASARETITPDFWIDSPRSLIELAENGK